MARADPPGRGPSLMGDQTFKEIIQGQSDREFRMAKLSSELIPGPLKDAVDGIRKLHMLVNGARIKSMSSPQDNTSKRSLQYVPGHTRDTSKGKDK